MEAQKIVNLLNGSDNENSKFATKKQYVIDSERKVNYLPDNEVEYLTSSLESSLLIILMHIFQSEEILLLLVVMQIQKLHFKTVHHLKKSEQK